LLELREALRDRRAAVAHVSSVSPYCPPALADAHFAEPLGVGVHSDIATARERAVSRAGRLAAP